MVCKFPEQPEDTGDIFADDDKDLCEVHNSYRYSDGDVECMWALQHEGEE